MKLLFSTLSLICFAFQIQAQLTMPPSGANQKSIITQYIGSIAHVSITYNSPDVTAPSGQVRKGQIWGKLVPHGLTDLGFGYRNPAPWRAGANENTTIEFSHDMLLQGKKIKAGKYGFHLITQAEGPWTIILSNNSTAWGSYFYKASEDAIRVEAVPSKNEYREWLTYEFTDRQSNKTTCTFMWEEVKLPFTIEIEDNHALYLTKMRNDLQNSPGFTWQSWNQAANYCLQNNVNLEEGLEWAEASISSPFIGQANFTTLSTKSAILNKLNKGAEATETLMKAVEHPTANVTQVHQLGRQLISQGNKQTALKVFELNFEKFDGAWPTHTGLARGYSAVGEYDKALKHAEIALTQAPDQLNKDALVKAIEKLKTGEDIN